MFHWLFFLLQFQPLNLPQPVGQMAAHQHSQDTGSNLSAGSYDRDEEVSARPQGYKTFFMLNSTEHEISTARKN